MYKKISTLSALLVLVVGTLALAGKASAAGSGTIFISPASATNHVGDTITLTVRENSGSTAVNAESFVGAYNQNLLQFLSWDFSTSAFEVAASSSGGSGAIAADRGTTSSTLTGDQIIGKANFKVLAPGTTSVTVDNASVVLQTSNSTDQVGTRTGSNLTLVTGFENRVAHRPNGQAYYFKVDKRYYIPNPAVRNCVMVRYNTGTDFLTSDAEVNAFTDGGQTAHCPYELETGLNFVREQSSTTVWKVNANGSKQHVGSLCVVDPYTTVLKKFHIFIVPDGETLGHVVGADWFASGSNCVALPG
jgi:hypothetical protein